MTCKCGKSVLQFYKISWIWIVILIILLGSRLFRFKWRLLGESYGQLLLYLCYLTNNQLSPPPRISPFSNNSWQSLLSVPLRLKLRRWIWTSVGLRAEIFAWQSSLAMCFVLNFWAKFGTEVFNKGRRISGWREVQHFGKCVIVFTQFEIFLHV